MGFDLRDESWIPVRLGGRSMRVGLRELLHRAHEIEDLELPVPPAASGLLRILAAITARVARNDEERLDDMDLAENVRKWRHARDRVLARRCFDASAVDAYLDREVPEGRFDLFGDRPFLQDPRLDKECLDAKGKPNSSGVNKLVFGRPTGVNGAVLFGHFMDTDPVPVSPAEAAWHLIAQLYYGPSGQCTPRRITSVRPGSGDAGPLRKTVSFHPWAPDLFTTLVLSVPVPGGSGAEPDEEDRCPWEMEELLNPLGPLPKVTWPGRLLTGRARHAVLLAPSADHATVTDAFVTWSTHAPAQAASDPYVILDPPKSGDGTRFPRPADGRRALWRDLDALLLKDHDGQSKRPYALENLPRALLPVLRVRAYGFDQDGQQRDSGWFEASTPPVLRWQQEVDERMALYVGQCRQAADEVGGMLEYAARLAWKLATDPGQEDAEKVRLDAKRPGPWRDRALAQYWPVAGLVFWGLVTPERCDTPPHQPFVDAALDALDSAIGAVRADVRTARARSRARRCIRAAIPRSAGR
ncbi:type I-E CRISPR-associated protein Cse1/CasA [Wenjunlia tyrosinilytica]|uniref:Type I-E CRISPR-associated protein Cse1/CasA n=1 Tax=Wenjunlia tyrosinilytica TaxID=1544741 RepID=A0A918E2F6_9ACTN|nr:type I-E CRISPR-associated protein Cse1/CasA [Wenjunlia tyrosinilytica]GGO99249.1 type I-E CRISPR-associated protein Cse1/CasA [Wenjunlia tyrosinilytica]